MSYFNDTDGLVQPYPKVTLRSNTHVYNDHALITSKLTIMRDVNTPLLIFRMLEEEITLLLSAYAFSNLPTQPIEVTTPICKTMGSEIAEKIALVPILRAGLGMDRALMNVVPQAKIGHCGVYRDKETKRPVEYYWKMPEGIESMDVFVLDPMLATGGSVKYVIDKLKAIGCKSIHTMHIVGAPQGIDLIQQHHPDVEMYIAHLDEGLNRNAYIVPGLGDAGDRLFGTK